MKKEMTRNRTERRFAALAYDVPMLAASIFLFLYISPSTEGRQRLIYIALQFVICAACVFAARGLAGVYRQILRYGGSRMYIHLILADMCAGIAYYVIQLLLPEGPMRVNFIRAVCIITLNLLGAVAARLLYQYVFEFGSRKLWTYPVFILFIPQHLLLSFCFCKLFPDIFQEF